MLQINTISYSIAGRQLFDGSSARIPTGHKVGLVGANGTGKSTLFKLIRGELMLDGGTISVPQKTRIGGVAQEVPSSDITILASVLSADTERAELLAAAESETDAMRIAEIQTRLSDIDAWSAEARAATILRGLGFDEPELQRPCSDYSGGWRMRVALAGVLFSAPDLLLLDEPTNYLDLEGALWLENYLSAYPHTVIIISHDRGLLNRAVNSILHLSEQQLTFYQGPYDQFTRQRAEKRSQATAMARKTEARRAHLQKFVDRFRAKASKAKQAQARLKMIERLDSVVAPEEAQEFVFTFPNPEELSPPILRMEEASTGYDGLEILHKLNLRIDQDDRIALLGKNGQGKSTLAKLLAERLALISGGVWRSGKLRVGYFAQHQVDELHIDETPLMHLQRERPNTPPARLRAQLAGFGLGSAQVETKVGQLSGGQKARLSLMLATLDAPHLLILDEPTNHLDIESREALVEALLHYNGAVILVSHDMHLLSLVVDRLWLVKDGLVTPYEEDLEAYRRFLLMPAEKPAKKAKASLVTPQKRAPQADLNKLRKELQKSEARVEKLMDMREKLTQKLADPALYAPERAGEAQLWRDKYAELRGALDKAEGLWMAAETALDAALASSK